MNHYKFLTNSDENSKGATSRENCPVYRHNLQWSPLWQNFLIFDDINPNKSVLYIEFFYNSLS